MSARTSSSESRNQTPHSSSSFLSFAPSRLRALPLRLYLFTLFVLLLAFALRVHEIGAQSLWHDEGNSVVQAARSLPDIAANAARDIHPPLYYWMLAGWHTLTGESEFSLRMLSAFASLIAVAFTIGIGSRLYGRWMGVLAGVFVALNTFNLYYAQEARMYALLALFAAGSTYAMVGMMRRPTWRWMVLLALTTAGGLWTHYAYPLVMIGQGAAVVIGLITLPKMRGRFLWFYTGGNGLGIALFAPWIPTALDRVIGYPNTGDPLPFAESLNTILNWFAFGITAQNVTLAIVILLLLFGLIVVRGRRGAAGMAIPVLMAALPVGIFLAAGLFRVENLKFLLPAQIGFALWMARGVHVIMNLTRRRLIPPFSLYGKLTDEGQTIDYRAYAARQGLKVIVTRLAAGAAALWVIVNLWAGVPALYNDPAYQRADYRGIAAAIMADARPGDAIILDAPNQEEVFRYYYRGDAPLYPLPAGLGGDDEATRAAVEQVMRDYERITVLFWGEAERDPRRVVETTLDARAFEIDNQWVRDVRVARYVTPQPLNDSCSSEASFGGLIALEACAYNGADTSAGDVIQVQFTWNALDSIDKRYKVTLQLLNAEGILVAQRDSEPVGGTSFTTEWRVGEPIHDPHALIVPPDLSAGTYMLIVGWYDADDPSVRLRFGDADALELAAITIKD